MAEERRSRAQGERDEEAAAARERAEREPALASPGEPAPVDEAALSPDQRAARETPGREVPPVDTVPVAPPTTTLPGAPADDAARARLDKAAIAVAEHAAEIERMRYAPQPHPADVQARMRTERPDAPRGPGGETALAGEPPGHRMTRPRTIGDIELPPGQQATPSGALVPRPAAIAPGDVPAPRAFFLVPSTYQFDGRVEIFASGSMPRAIEPHTLKASTVTADAQGRKVVPIGTVLSLSVDTPPLVYPATAASTAYGVLGANADVTDANTEVPVILGGWLRSDRCWDNGVYGTIIAGHITQLPQIVFRTRDL